jgi:hypothetical protein
LTIDNVKLVKKGTCQNLISNGEFEQPALNGHWKYLSSVPGWITSRAEIGYGKIYNCRWNSQVLELDADRNIEVSQSFKMDCDYNVIRT